MGFYADHIVPRLINLGMRRPDLLPYRQRAIARAEGRVLEIGVGSGLNLPYYTRGVKEVLGIDPHPRLLAMAEGKTSAVPCKVMEGSAEAIPLDDGSVDTVVTTWTLCSIPNVESALEEMRRVLRPGGRLVFVEHGRTPDRGVRRWQDRLTPLWKSLAGGCHLNRPIPELVRQAGFRVSHLETSYMRGPKALTFTYEGLAQPF